MSQEVTVYGPEEEAADEARFEAWKTLLRDSASSAYSNEILARCVIKAAQLHEQSYVPGDRHEIGLGMSPGEYKIDHEEAATQACADYPHLQYIVWLLLARRHGSWNDILDWAAAVLGKENLNAEFPKS